MLWVGTELGCRTFVRFILSVHSPQANSIHGIDESVCLQSMEVCTQCHWQSIAQCLNDRCEQDVAAVMTQFMAEWCGLVKVHAPVSHSVFLFCTLAGLTRVPMCVCVQYEAPAEAEGEEAESSSKKSTRASSKRKR